MNYPTLSLSADSIQRAFSKRNIAVKNKPLTKTITQPGKKDNMSEPFNQSKDGEIKDCNNCDYKTSTYEDLFDHIKKTHVRQGLKHKCPLCDFSNIIPARVKAHLYEVHLKIGTMKKCDECDYENLKYNNLYVHKRQNHMKHLKQKCTECENTYSYLSKLKQHFNQVHQRIRRKQNNLYKVICRKQICPDFQTKGCKQIEDHSLFVCDQCPFSSRRKDMTQSHVQFVHEGVIFKCDQCTICTVKTRGALERHVLLKHPGPEQKANPLLCTEIECTFISFIDRDMKRHVQEKHEGLIRYRCDIMNCNFGTYHKKTLSYHTKSYSFVTAVVHV